MALRESTPLFFPIAAPPIEIVGGFGVEATRAVGGLKERREHRGASRIAQGRSRRDGVVVVPRVARVAVLDEHEVLDRGVGALEPMRAVVGTSLPRARGGRETRVRAHAQVGRRALARCLGWRPGVCCVGERRVARVARVGDVTGVQARVQVRVVCVVWSVLPCVDPLAGARVERRGGVGREAGRGLGGGPARRRSRVLPAVRRRTAPPRRLAPKRFAEHGGP